MIWAGTASCRCSWWRGARAAGLVFSPRDVFTARTPAGLAAIAETAAGVAREGAR